MRIQRSEMPRARPETSWRVASALVVPLIAACPRFPADLCDGPGCTSADASTVAVAVDASDSNDAAVSPVVDNDDAAHAVHMAPNGSDDTGDGTRENPVQSLDKAIALTTAARSFVRVCEGTYAQTVALTTRDRVLTVTGGYACPGSSDAWASAHGTTTFVSTDTHRIEAAGGTLRMVRLERSDAAGLNVANVALTIATRGRASLIDVSVQAGAGSPGIPALDAATAALSGRDGANPTGAAGGVAIVTACVPGSSSWGGRGGTSNGGTQVARGERGARTPSSSARANEGNAGDGGPLQRACTVGLRGFDGTLAIAPQATSELAHDTFLAASGSAGSPGEPGQGGGGGGTAVGESGAPSGASGGCGGEGGRAGGGGASSIAMVVRQGIAELTRTQLISGTGGHGGRGGRGANGAAGGHGIQASVAFVPGPCGSGDGGYGAGGAGGGGGQGGWSLGIVLFSIAELRVEGRIVTADEETSSGVTLGSAGEGGTGGDGGTEGSLGASERGHDGKAGVRQAIVLVPTT